MQVPEISSTDPALAQALAAARRALAAGQPDTAVALLTPWAAQGARDVGALTLLGEAHVRAGRPDEGVRCLANAVALAPADDALRLMLADALDRAGRGQAAQVQRSAAGAVGRTGGPPAAASAQAVVAGAGAVRAAQPPPVQLPPVPPVQPLPVQPPPAHSAAPPVQAVPPFVLPVSGPPAGYMAAGAGVPRRVSTSRAATYPRWSPLNLGPLFTEPAAFFEQIGDQTDAKAVAGFLAVLLLAGALLAALVRENRVAGGAPDVPTLMGHMMGGFAVSMSVALAAGLIGAFALAGLHHAAARAFGSAAPLTATFAVVGYALAPVVFAAHAASAFQYGVSPVNDPAVVSASVLMTAAAVGSWVLMFIGFRAVHRMRPGGALAAVLLPAALVICAAIALAFLQTARLAALAPHFPPASSIMLPPGGAR